MPDVPCQARVTAVSEPWFITASKNRCVAGVILLGDCGNSTTGKFSASRTWYVRAHRKGSQTISRTCHAPARLPDSVFDVEDRGRSNQGRRAGRAPRPQRRRCAGHRRSATTARAVESLLNDPSNPKHTWAPLGMVTSGRRRRPRRRRAATPAAPTTHSPSGTAATRSAAIW